MLLPSTPVVIEDLELHGVDIREVADVQHLIARRDLGLNRSLRRLDFEAPDRETFPCLDLAYRAVAGSEAAPAVLKERAGKGVLTEHKALKVKGA